MYVLLCLYAVMGVATLIAYRMDKVAALRGQWRISEATLHTMELCFGWPGAWLAQKLFRHKCSKTSYQVEFWIVVVLNLVAVWYFREMWMRWTFADIAEFVDAFRR